MPVASLKLSATSPRFVETKRNNDQRRPSVYLSVVKDLKEVFVVENSLSIFNNKYKNIADNNISTVGDLQVYVSR